MPSGSYPNFCNQAFAALFSFTGIQIRKVDESIREEELTLRSGNCFFGICIYWSSSKHTVLHLPDAVRLCGCIEKQTNRLLSLTCEPHASYSFRHIHHSFTTRCNSSSRRIAFARFSSICLRRSSVSFFLFFSHERYRLILCLAFVT